MAEINLLQTDKPKTSNRDIYGILNKVGTILLIVVIGFYVYLFVAQSQVNKQITVEQEKNQQITEEIKKIPKYQEFLATQTKIKNIKTILDNHLAWSKFIQAFSNATLNTATYKKFVAKNDGTATINGSVPDFKNLDKLIDGFQLPEFDFIKEVKLTNVSLAETDSTSAIDFNLNVIFNKNLLVWDKNQK